MKLKKTGVLYVVATPIGNMQDITFRAIEVLKTVDIIVAEDTRHAMPLLKHYLINKPTVSMHEFNERERLKAVIEALQEGKSIALISDAGTPLISDPGFPLVREARKLDLSVIPIPGPCALIAALSVAGLPTDRFTFEGFLPQKSEARCHTLARLLHETRTMVFYEAPHRLLATLKDMRQIFGEERKATVARELTKIYESVQTHSLNTLIELYEEQENKLKGEIVILIDGVDEEKSITREVVPQEVLELLLAELPLKQAASLASKITGERKNILYDLALSKRGQK